jgi:hypothetical protein
VKNPVVDTPRKNSWAERIKDFRKPEFPKLPAEKGVTIARGLTYEQAYGRKQPQ